jgi:nitrogen fixation/metabolism regulation signal transduction histidine kinase
MEKYNYCVNIAGELEVQLKSDDKGDSVGLALKTVKHLINQLRELKPEIKQKKPKKERAGLV